MTFRGLLLLLSALLCHTPIYAESVKFIIPDFKPYTYFEQGEFKGLGVEKIRQIMNRMGASYELTLAPNYGRAVEELKRNRFDGLFLATENEERNQFAVISEAVVFNRWSWFIRKDHKLLPHMPAFREETVVATHINTNTHKWLLKNHYRVEFSPSKINRLPTLLVSRRVDAVFLSEEVFKQACIEQGIDPQSFIQIVEVTKSFAAYFHKNYLQAHPDFMDKFNNAILRE